ncbi:MAG TPA: hypothetical protein PKH07_07210, partial [bacterium]|nr:hypothetical protein [bacterium]
VRCLPDLPGSLAVVLLLLALEMNARPLVLGLVFAIVCCLKPTFATLLPLVLWGACDEKSWKARLTAALYVGFGSLLIIWPWMLRNFLITRNPFYSFLGYDLLSHTPSFRNVYVWNLTDAPNPMGFALRHPIEMLLKVFQVIRFTAGFCRPEAMWVLFFAIPAMLFFLPRIAMRNRLLAAIMLIVLPLFVTHTEARYFAPVLVPLVVLCLWVTEHKLRERTGAWPLAVFWTASVLVAFLLLNVSGLAGLRKHSYSRNWLRWDQVAFFENRTTPEHLIASDVPFAISWECNRTTTFLPFREGDLRAVDKVHPVDFVFVQQPRFNASLHDYEKSTWFQENFRILNIFDDDTGSRLYRRRTSILGGFDAPQLCQVRGNLFVLRERIVHSVDLPSLSRHPIQTVPEGVVRINGDETTGGFHLMSDDGTILGLAGAAGYNPEPPLEGVPIDFKFTPNGQGIFFLMDDGRVVPRGDAVDFGVRAGVIEQPLRLAVTSTGKGVLVLSADGTVVVCGDAKSGYERYFGEPLARDIALVPGTNDYYILDAFGSTHPSRTDSILAVGPYRADRRWALDLEILPGGAPYVLSDEGEILRYELKRADQVQATVP